MVLWRITNGDTVLHIHWYLTGKWESWRSLKKHVSQVCRKIKRTDRRLKDVLWRGLPPISSTLKLCTKRKERGHWPGWNKIQDCKPKTTQPAEWTLSRGTAEKRWAASWKDDSGHVMEKMWTLVPQQNILVLPTKSKCVWSSVGFQALLQVVLWGDKVGKDGRMGVAAVFSELSGYY